MKSSRFEEKVVCRDELDDGVLGLLSIMFSDENLASEFVMKQLQTWKSNCDYSLVLMTRENLNLTSTINNICGLLSTSLLNKINCQFDEKDGSIVTPQDRMVCSICKNFGSIILSRTNSAVVRFVCENCAETTKLRTYSISDLIWNRRCNESSASQIATQSNTMKSIKSELDKVIGTKFDVIPSMMIVKKDDVTNTLTLSALFTMNKFRKGGYGERLIRFIPSFGKNFSISICTAGLESEYLFSKYIYKLLFNIYNYSVFLLY